MASDDKPRKRIQHYDDAADVRELTFSCYQRRPLLTPDVWLALLSKAINAGLVGHRYGLAAFVFMPEHVHLLVFPQPGASKIDKLLFAIKRPFSYRIKQRLAAAEDPLLGELTVRQRPGVTTFRFWQEGPGYDRNFTSAATTETAMDYIHLNPVRRGLCERAVDWRWSSARCHHDPTAPIDAALPRIDPLPADYF